MKAWLSELRTVLLKRFADCLHSLSCAPTCQAQSAEDQWQNLILADYVQSFPSSSETSEETAFATSSKKELLSHTPAGKQKNGALLDAAYRWGRQARL